MTVTPAQMSTNALDVLNSISRKGVRLWVEGSQLRYTAPPGALSKQELDRLKERKGELIALLSSQDAAVSPHRSMPLAYPQLSHWHWYQLDRKRHIRQIASAMRLRGALNVAALHRSLNTVVERHEAFRVRFSLEDGAVSQRIQGSLEFELPLVDLRAVPESNQKGEIQQRIRELILKPTDVLRDPLLVAQLLRLRDDHHVLLIAMEHSISDMYSLGAFLHEMLTAYANEVTGEPAKFPDVPIPFSQYVLRLQAQQEAWLREHGAYWRRRLDGCQRVRFPSSLQPEGEAVGWGTAAFEIDAELRRALQSWCQARRVTLVLTVFAAYAAQVLRWCNNDDAAFRYVTDGRMTPALCKTLGYLAFMLPLRVRIQANDTFEALVMRVTEEYYNACEHADAGFFESIEPRPQFVRNSTFNWIPQDTRIDVSTQSGIPNAIHGEQISFEHPMLDCLERDTEPMALFYDSGTSVAVRLHYSRALVSATDMERFAAEFVRRLRLIVDRPGSALDPRV